MRSDRKLFQMILSAMFLALALVLPLLTGQIPQIGSKLCPMHLPVLLCGFFCGPWYALGIGLAAPLLRFLMFGMPPLMPSGIGMCFELATYGCVSGLMYKLLPQRRLYIYVSLIIAMLAGRVVWGVVRVILYGITSSAFGWSTFIAGAFLNAIPGIIVQIVLVPMLVIALNKYTITRLYR